MDCIGKSGCCKSSWKTWCPCSNVNTTFVIGWIRVRSICTSKGKDWTLTGDSSTRGRSCKDTRIPFCCIDDKGRLGRENTRISCNIDKSRIKKVWSIRENWWSGCKGTRSIGSSSKGFKEWSTCITNKEVYQCIRFSGKREVWSSIIRMEGVTWSCDTWSIWCRCIDSKSESSTYGCIWRKSIIFTRYCVCCCSFRKGRSWSTRPCTVCLCRGSTENSSTRITEGHSGSWISRTREGRSNVIRICSICWRCYYWNTWCKCINFYCYRANRSGIYPIIKIYRDDIRIIWKRRNNRNRPESARRYYTCISKSWHSKNRKSIWFPCSRNSWSRSWKNRSRKWRNNRRSVWRKIILNCKSNHSCIG